MAKYNSTVRFKPYPDKFNKTKKKKENLKNLKKTYQGIEKIIGVLRKW